VPALATLHFAPDQFRSTDVLRAALRTKNRHCCVVLVLPEIPRP
jgi:hypothetical protein